MKAIFPTLSLVALAACSGLPTEDRLGFDNLSTDLRRASAAAFLDQPFEGGTVHVVAEERGEMKTYILVPCRGGTHVCGETLRGRAGHSVVGPDYVQVTGAYPGRTFLLAPGGNGVLRRHGVDSPLAWD